MTTVDLDGLKLELERRGWRIYKQVVDRTGVDWYAARRTDDRSLPECLSNHKPVQLVITPYSAPVSSDVKYESAQIDLTASPDGQRWLRFMEYAIPLADVSGRLDPCVAMLESAWKTAAGASLDATR